MQKASPIAGAARQTMVESARRAVNCVSPSKHSAILGARRTMRSLIAGNWKMNLTPDAAEAFVSRVLPLVERSEAEIALFPAFPSLDRVGRALRRTPIALGSQDVCAEERGAFTGGVSAEMLVACGCRYVLVGHSERRRVFGEDDALLRRKLETALHFGLSPILCVGETLEERQSGHALTVVARQLNAGLAGLPIDAVARIAVAYEPVWAIGTGETATEGQAQEAAQAVRRVAEELHGTRAANTMRVLYGGSVNPANARGLLALDDVNGALVGGASLDPEAFAAIAAAAERT